MKPETIEFYDATDRDGDQTLGVSLSVEQKIAIARVDDEFGIDTVEVGFPESNEVDDAVFAALRRNPLKNAQHAAFGKTRKKNTEVGDDQSLQALKTTEAPVLTVVGKSSKLHVQDAIHASLVENRRMIADSVAALQKKGTRVIYDAEHFFDAYYEGEDGREYAMDTLKAAVEAGVETVVLCDTNGGQTPERIAEAVRAVREAFEDVLIGIHPHNDRGLATANMLAAVQAGARHVQGTWNRTGERTGNLDLVEALGNIHLLSKEQQDAGETGFTNPALDNIGQLTQMSQKIASIMRMPRIPNQPFVGERAFTHKGGMHTACYPFYEFADPEEFGNRRIIVGSKQAGRSTVREIIKVSTMIDEGLRKRVLEDTDLQDKILREIKHLETEGYRFDRAPASLELLALRVLDAFEPTINELKPPVVLDVLGGDTNATIKIRINGDGEEYIEASEGDGPLDALYGALRKALTQRYPSMSKLQLTDYRVEIAPVSTEDGTAAIVDVYAEFTDGEETWHTTAASADSIEAGWKAVLDGVEYKLLKEKRSETE